MAPPPEKPVFTLLPAVDVADGRAVRLVQGAAGTETDYGDPIEAARGWVEQGAPWIHLVDLDAAFGRGENRAVLAAVVEAVGADVHVEISGGIRDDAALDAALATGASRAIVGTAAMENPDWVRSAIARHGDHIAVSLDVRGHTLAARGWTTEGGDLFETLTRLDADGCARYVVTDVEKDGMMHGPNLHLLKMEAHFAELFQQAQSAGDINVSRDPRVLARRYQSDLLGLRVSAEREGVDAKAIAAEIANGLIRL